MDRATTYGRLSYDMDAKFAAHRRASARVESRDLKVGSVLIAGHAGDCRRGARICPGISPAARLAVLRLAGREVREEAGCAS
jgi:hypothetical protein